MPTTPMRHRVRLLESRVHKSPSATASIRLSGRPRMRRNARILALYPLCAICESRGLITPAKEVDHRLPLIDGGGEDEGNLWGLCHDCHADKTAREASRRAQGLSGEVPDLPPMRAPRSPVVA